MDFYTDSEHHELCRILKELSQNNVTPPDYVLQKSAEETKIADLPPSAFACPTSRQFPIHTKADTWLSAAFANHDQSLTKQAKARVKKMIHKGASLWDIPQDELVKLDNILSPRLQKSAEESVEEGKILLKTAEECEEYCIEVFSKLPKMELEQRRSLCRDLLKTSKENHWGLQEDVKRSLEQSACQGTCPKERALPYLHKIAREVSGNTSLFGIMKTCMKGLERGKKLPGEEILRKTAALTDLVLKSFSGYEKGFDLPERHLFSITRSDLQALKDDLVKIPGGKVIKKSALESNLKKVGADIYSLTGELPLTSEEVLGQIQTLPPVLAERLTCWE